MRRQIPSTAKSIIAQTTGNAIIHGSHPNVISRADSFTEHS